MITTREVSNLAYYQIKDSGLLSRVRFEVYEQIVFAGRPISAYEIEQAGRNKRSTVSARMVELERLGVIERVGTVHLAGSLRTTYRDTQSLPDKTKLKKAEVFPDIWVCLTPDLKIAGVSTTSFESNQGNVFRYGIKKRTWRVGV